MKNLNSNQICLCMNKNQGRVDFAFIKSSFFNVSNNHFRKTYRIKSEDHTEVTKVLVEEFNVPV